MSTIGVDLWGGQARGMGPNNRTVMREAARPPRHRDLRELFVGAYPSVAARCRAVDEPGLALVAVEETSGRPMGLVRLAARVDRHVAAIVGRHDSCDLFLNAHAEMALRHLTVILDPVASWRAGDSTVRYRVLDLRTTDGFNDEHGRNLRGLRCEGPAVLRCGGYVLFVMPLGDPTDWPTSAADAWSYLPERVYFDELGCDPEGSLTRIPLYNRKAGARSAIIRTSGPRDTGAGLVERGDQVGMLELIGPRTRNVLKVGVAALRDGVLLGRYARCDGARLDDDSLSRVHALLIQIDDAVLVIDTASRNGTSEVGKPATRVITLDWVTELALGKSTRARWSYVS